MTKVSVLTKVQKWWDAGSKKKFFGSPHPVFFAHKYTHARAAMDDHMCDQVCDQVCVTMCDRVCDKHGMYPSHPFEEKA